jgi:hypothetical protein
VFISREAYAQTLALSSWRTWKLMIASRSGNKSTESVMLPHV